MSHEQPKSTFVRTAGRFILIVLTLVTILTAGQSLLSSWQQPQFQSRLELYQTNLTLQAVSLETSDSGASVQPLQDAILGTKPLDVATQQYQEARKSAQRNLDKIKTQLAQLQSQPETAPATSQPQSQYPPATNPNSEQQQLLQQSLNQVQKLIPELDLRLGILQVQQGKTDAAFKTWSEVQQSLGSDSDFSKVAAVLSGLWSDPPRLLPNSEPLIQANLDGWFRYSALEKLYQLQQRQDALTNLKTSQQEVAETAMLRLSLIGTVPVIAALIGVGLLLFLLGERLVKGKAAILAQNADVTWSTPWNAETILVVFVVGFFFTGQFLVPIAIKVVLLPLVKSVLPIKTLVSSVRLQALSVFISYFFVALGALSVLYLAIKRFFPLPIGWFRFRFKDKWFLWGFGGYCIALPVVVVVSLINQQLWKGQGGSNPLLQLVLESQDSVALTIFFSTAAIAAPIFEEILFRGFLLPSLTRYLPVWGSILISSFLFAAAHLSLAEILPLFSLGIILGIVYTRSRNLLAPMLLHSLWNSGTLLSLFILGSPGQ
ncbi:type II CAAX prenyl endopeptidase Rce1 family protein [Scytonema sp. NUACC26]|uniref:CPBP family glutamic-type intramembrane protease n=1 Tax=Scytonema sp. NUACC26 TaxID=3140176 RepID=UPI0034DCB97E